VIKIGIRYGKIDFFKNKREIVLLKSFPCIYGKCSFCNYIEDNSKDEHLINKINFETLQNITGEFGILEVINSGSVFELPHDTLQKIKDIAIEKNIGIIYFEIYYGYMNRIDEIKKKFGNIEIRFKMGIETFDNDFRVNTLNKNFKLDKDAIRTLNDKIFSVCLMVCVKGQTKEMIDNDIKIAMENFKVTTINVFINNGTPIERDPYLYEWFINKYSYLKSDTKIEILLDNKDLTVYEQ
jgi:uncharacterized Fe-S cluster-containing MiaB family protein